MKSSMHSEDVDEIEDDIQLPFQQEFGNCVLPREITAASLNVFRSEQKSTSKSYT